MKFNLLLLAALLCFAAETGASIKNVPGDYATIQAAINASVNGDTVLVAPGTYLENINFRGRNIVLTSRFYITGDPATIYSTIIDGSSPSNPDTGSCVMINRGEDSTTVLQGFSITKGTGTKWNDEHNAGIYREGGGILVQYSSPVIKDNIIFNNTVTDITGVVSTGGGGVRIGDSFVRFYNNIVMNNTSRYGAGMVLNHTGGEYNNNVICANYGSFQFSGGSGMWVNQTHTRPATITNNTIANNSSTAGFCGVFVNSGLQLFRNNIIWGNTSPSNVQVSGQINIAYSNVQGGIPGAGNINQDPLFADSNYILSAGSPCIDKGDSSVIYNDVPDISNPLNAKYPSRGGLRNDMGAYGGPRARILSGQLIGIQPIGNNLAEKYTLYQNYPNPFNPATSIIFDIPEAGYISLEVFDITGRKVSTLVSSYLKAGRHSAVFNATGFASGVYFTKLFYKSGTAVTKMILVK